MSKDTMSNEMNLSEEFGDPMELLNSRNWLEKAIKDKGAKPYAMGVSVGDKFERADISFDLEGHSYNVSIRPLKNKNSGANRLRVRGDTSS